MASRSVGSSQRRARLRALVQSVVLASAGLALGACSQQPKARSIIGPDGSSMFHVSCDGDQGACFELAGQHCPGGYRLAPLFSPSSNNFLVRCATASAPEVARAPVQVAPPSVASRPPEPAAIPEMTPWPPPAQPWPNTNPWPTPSAEANVNPTQLPPTVRLPNGQIDIGY